MKIIDWVKHNKLAFILILLLLFILVRNYSFNRSYGVFNKNYSSQYSVPQSLELGRSNFGMAALDSYDSAGSYEIQSAPSSKSLTDSSSPRMITQSASFSLLVKNVEKSTKQIITYVNENEGFLVSSTLSNPENSANAYLTINIPSKKLNDTLDYLKSISVKVVSQNLIGRDITEEYQDINSRLEILRANKSRFEEIMARTGVTTEILQIQREIFSIQDQIDSLIGRQKYLEEKAKYSQITINLSTDELSLPYTPDNKWRPEVVFKNAVRSLLKTLQSLGNLAIWLLVFSVIIIPAYFIYKLVRKLIKKKI